MEALIYFAVWAVFIFLMMRFGCGAHIMGHGRHDHGEEKTSGRHSQENLRWIPPETAVDPVCGKSVATDQAKSSLADGAVYYFCSRECREVFEAAPHLYIGVSKDDSTQKLEHSHV